MVNPASWRGYVYPACGGELCAMQFNFTNKLISCRNIIKRGANISFSAFHKIYKCLYFIKISVGIELVVFTE